MLDIQIPRAATIGKQMIVVGCKLVLVTQFSKYNIKGNKIQ